MSHRPSARDLGIPFDGQPGPHNAITDVPGVEVGHTTLIEGDGPLVIGKGPIRTGVTTIHPLGKEILGSVAAAWFPFNGNGEMTGTTWIEESGCLEGPILLTNTVSIGTVRDAVIKWARKKHEAAGTFNPNEYGLTLALPVVAETWDGGLNDIFGFHVREEHVAHALDSAQSGLVPQGNVGGGTGMTCYDFKGGIGSSSRVVCCYGRSPDRASVLSRSPDRDTPIPSPQSPVPSPYIVGVLVQANHGNRSDLLIRGVPVGRELPLSEIPHYRDSRKSSILIMIGTDAPLLPQQLKRLARRATLGLGRTGTVGNNGSGDIFLAFSTARGLSPFAQSAEQKGTVPFSQAEQKGSSVVARSPDHDTAAPSPQPPVPRPYYLSNAEMDPLFEATTEATEEAIINAVVAAETMTGRDHHTAHSLPHPRLQEIMRKYNRL